MFQSAPVKSRKDFSLSPLLWLAAFFAAGILTAGFLIFSWPISLGLCLFFGCLSIALNGRGISTMLLGAAFFSAGALSLQISDQNLGENRIKRIYDEKQIESNAPVEIEGVLERPPELAVSGFFLTLETQQITFKNEPRAVSGRVKLFAPVSTARQKDDYENLDLQYGSKVRIFCRLQRDDNFLNPGVISLKEVLDQKEIDATGLIKSPLLVEKIGLDGGFSPLGWVFEQRQNLIVEFRKKFSVSTAGVLIASLLGDANFLDKPTSDTFRDDGTFHVLVISGTHITFIGGLAIVFLQFFTRRKFWQFFLASGFLWAYALAVGAEVPVVRAAVMVTILLFSQVVGRRGTLLNSLGACGLILLVWRPDDIFTSSFQLTFASVGAIVAAVFPLIEKLREIGQWSPSAEAPFPPDVPGRLKRICETFYWREDVWEIERKRQIWSANLFKSPRKLIIKKINFQKAAAYFFEAIVVSLIAQLCLLPFAVVYFHRLSPAAILLTAWAEILIALETFAALAAIFFSQFSEIMALPLIRLTEIFNRLLLGLPNFLVEHDWASFRLPAYPGWMKIVYVLYFVPVIILIVTLNRWKPFDLVSEFRTRASQQRLRLVFASLLIFTALIVFHPLSAPPGDGRLHIDFLDVGQGDSALLTFPNGETMLIDGGGKPSFNKNYVRNETDDEPELFIPDTQTIGESVVTPFLWSRGLDKVDYLLASHADTDHIQGLTAVAENFEVKKALFGRTPLKDTDFAELYQVLEKRDIPWMELVKGDTFNISEVRIEILYPEPDDAPDAVSDNNHSLVLRVVYGNKKFLFTGDIEKEAESAVLQSPDYLQADVVKVAHHGSHTSSTQSFIEATKAEYAIISVGKTSPFGHPNRDVLERWAKAGTKIYQTGQCGTISVTTDGENLEIETFK